MIVAPLARPKSIRAYGFNDHPINPVDRFWFQTQGFSNDSVACCRCSFGHDTISMAALIQLLAEYYPQQFNHFGKCEFHLKLKLNFLSYKIQTLILKKSNY